MTAEKNSSYGYLLRMSGTTENMYLPGKAIKFETWYKINEETLAKLQDIVNLEIDQTKDMAQNYNVSQLNRIKDIIENDATLFAYSVNKTPYKIAFGISIFPKMNKAPNTNPAVAIMYIKITKKILQFLLFFRRLMTSISS